MHPPLAYQIAGDLEPDAKQADSTEHLINGSCRGNISHEGCPSHRLALFGCI
jgi:hypothetical protein